MKRSVWLCAFLIAILSGCTKEADSPSVASEAEATSTQSTTMTLDGDVSAAYTNGNFVIWTRKQGGGATSMTSMTSMTVAAGKSSSDEDVATEQKPSRDPIYDTLNVVAEAAIQPDGTFSLSVDVDEPKEVFFYILDAVSESGVRYAPTKGQNFVLESGSLSLLMDDRRGFVISGGKYNDIVFNSWKQSEEYIVARNAYRQLLVAVEGETEQERRARVDLMSEKTNEMFDVEGDGRAHIALNHPDPLVRKLTIQTAWLHGPWVLESLRGLAELTPDDPWAVESLARSEEAYAKRQAERQIAIGTEILDFSAENIEGETVALSDVRSDSEVVLLEFWASWCGPCLAEIPHMKSAYEKYRDDGFEIVSFTIDEAREDWVEASNDEELPWLNLGMGPDAEAPVKYNVTGVPKNYLIESSSGEIIGKDLRGHKLDEQLEKRFL